MTIQNKQIEDAGKAVSASASPPATGSGKGAFWYKTVSGIVEGFYVDSAGTQTQITSNGALVAAPGSGEANTASNVGTSGFGVFKQKTGVNFEFRKFLAGANITLSNPDTNTIQIDAAGGGGSVSDAVFGSGWNGDTTTAPSKNAVYDKIATLDTSIAAAEVASWLSFESGDVKILAIGTAAQLALVTAVKTLNSVTITLPGSAPYSVKIVSVKVRFSSTDMAGQTSATLIYPEPSGETSLGLSVRAQFFRYNSAYVSSGSTTTTVSNTSGTMTITGSGFTSSQEAYGQWVM